MNSWKSKESAGDNSDKRHLRHPDHARRIDPIKAKMTRIMLGCFNRQTRAILDDVRLRFHEGREVNVKEAKDDEEETPGTRRPENCCQVRSRR